MSRTIARLRPVFLSCLRPAYMPGNLGKTAKSDRSDLIVHQILQMPGKGLYHKIKGGSSAIPL
ncbi:MAG TPA: hypothetical protein VIK28_06595, partial [Sedimentisphaerales bacterium]